MSKEGIKPDPAKVEMRNYLAPTNISEVRQFLDLALYYRHFVPRIASPLHLPYLKNAILEWTQEC